jgi:hypothetical protein
VNPRKILNAKTGEVAQIKIPAHLVSPARIAAVLLKQSMPHL